MFKRSIFNKLRQRLSEDNELIQVLLGPRQVGKTTIVKQICELDEFYHLYCSADAPSIKSSQWLETKWEEARLKARSSTSFLLIIDEIQKISNWSEIVKKLYDQDRFNYIKLKVVLLGSSSNLLSKGLEESLAGRFEIIKVTHWQFSEMEQAFNFSLDQYIYFGGYPGASPFILDEQRWQDYLLNSLIETTVSKDILLMNKIDKPALLRLLFELGCQYSGKILSYQKMLGQLTDAGNTTTLAHYLKLLDQVSILSGISKYAGQIVRQRGSSPKFAVYNTALMSAFSTSSFAEVRSDPAIWGVYVESAIGSHILNQAQIYNFKVFYWREKNKEVDFILEKNRKLVALEVKSSLKKEALPGLDVFKRKYPSVKCLVIGRDGISIENFLNLELPDLF